MLASQSETRRQVDDERGYRWEVREKEQSSYREKEGWGESIKVEILAKELFVRRIYCHRKSTFPDARTDGHGKGE